MLKTQIFVAHRIDIKSECIENSIYQDIRCGAVFDSGSATCLAGDDTGENISERRMSFCEFTVQYWAWKNAICDYYGLCHYRRYLSFRDDKRFSTDEYNMIYVPALLPSGKKKFRLLDAHNMRALIEENDIVISEAAAVSKIPTALGSVKSVRELWCAHHNYFFDKAVIDVMFEEIQEKSPQYYQSALEYFSGEYHRGFNCYVLRKELFSRLCEFQFPIMFSIEKKLDTTGYTQTMHRTPAFVGEMLYGIFIYHITTKENWRTKELQLVFFSNTKKYENIVALILQGYIWSSVDYLLRRLVDPMMPKGSRQREWLKNVFYSMTPAKRRGVANIK